MPRQIFGIVKHIQMPVPQPQRIVTIAPILFSKKASVVGANTRPLDDGGLIIGFILFGLNSDFISELCN